MLEDSQFFGGLVLARGMLICFGDIRLLCDVLERRNEVDWRALIIYTC